MYIGFDFGTSYSVAATMDYETPRPLLPTATYGIPSVMYYSKEAKGVSIGENALEDGEGINSKNLILDIKTKLLNGDVERDGRVFTVEEIVGAICNYTLGEAVVAADKLALDSDIEGIVGAIPVKYGSFERNVVFSALQKCVGNSTPVMDIIKEPVAAAISYFKMKDNEDRCILVYDLGGGTCDIAIVKTDNGRIEHYDVVDDDMIKLGGKDWDEKVSGYIIEELVNKGIMVEDTDKETIRRAAIKAKETLSKKEVANIKVFINGKLEPVKLVRSRFDEITRDLLKETIDAAIALVNKHKELEGKIKEVICVGGSSNMPQVVEALKNAFPTMSVKIYHPEYAVVNGLAIYADMLSKIPNRGVRIAEEGDGIISDKINFSYGTDYKIFDEVSGQEVTRLHNFIVKGAKLPAEGQEFFSPTEDDMEYLPCDLYESESTKEKDDFNIGERLIGRIKMPLRKGISKNEKITMKVKVNRMGLIEVSANDSRGDKIEAKFEFNGSKWKMK